MSTPTKWKSTKVSVFAPLATADGRSESRCEARGVVTKMDLSLMTNSRSQRMLSDHACPWHFMCRCLNSKWLRRLDLSRRLDELLELLVLRENVIERLIHHVIGTSIHEGRIAVYGFGR
ncbi:MAG: hypothetical protein JWQ49_1406 [Edaphobacter sp.]|nr:hypothetical protein [Edaphobacter sp.]